MDYGSYEHPGKKRKTVIRDKILTLNLYKWSRAEIECVGIHNMDF